MDAILTFHVQAEIQIYSLHHTSFNVISCYAAKPLVTFLASSSTPVRLTLLKLIHLVTSKQLARTLSVTRKELPILQGAVLNRQSLFLFLLRLFQFQPEVQDVPDSLPSVLALRFDLLHLFSLSKLQGRLQQLHQAQRQPPSSTEVSSE